MGVLVRSQTVVTTTPVDDFPRDSYTAKRLTSNLQSILCSSSSLKSSLRPPKFSPGYTPLSWYHFSLRTIVIALLPTLAIFGAYCTWTLASCNGTFKSIFALIASEKPKFPGTEDALLTAYTDVGWLDRQLTVLVTFFAPVVDRDQGALTLFTIFAMGQFGAVWTLMVMESMRMGNRRRAVSLYVPHPGRNHCQYSFLGSIGTVGLIFQNISYTVTVPIWLLLHLFSSPVARPFPGTHASSVLLIDPWDLGILPASVTIGFIVPSILMTIPSPSPASATTHQRFIALWQAFPLWTVAAHYILRSTLRWLSHQILGQQAAGSRCQTPLGTSYLSNARHVYRFVLFLCISTHVTILALALVPHWAIPSSMPTLAHYASESLGSVYVPYLPLPSHQVSSQAEGAHTFLIWDLYIGSLAFICWAVLLYRNATTEKAIVDPTTSLPIYRELLLGERIEDGMAWRKLVGKIIMWTVIGGRSGRWRCCCGSEMRS
ncbi:hypothetical protein QTJ16_002214 [Diplocarpon rosae]|uniref:Uncharacterized protein n=1 Tax=Diplocarpon rosae TaxID=946125 RepID=A0AAD9T4M1_9HELO|nr:hypothetical protein QTJ16_002214 [Diplocarpon rosae]